ncbi:Leiomodin-2 [Physocladia obscura]|uniref:Leiomodin-2 n=1 Tax=Physocladia obscura TaxID=109957 RepID=A0AAD5SUG3_9FUNG|nr:Leiomodin-2 [Physocladia obscura]
MSTLLMRSVHEPPNLRAQSTLPGDEENDFRSETASSVGQEESQTEIGIQTLPQQIVNHEPSVTGVSFTTTEPEEILQEIHQTDSPTPEGENDEEEKQKEQQEQDDETTNESADIVTDLSAIPTSAVAATPTAKDNDETVEATPTLPTRSLSTKTKASLQMGSLEFYLLTRSLSQKNAPGAAGSGIIDGDENVESFDHYPSSPLLPPPPPLVAAATAAAPTRSESADLVSIADTIMSADAIMTSELRAMSRAGSRTGSRTGAASPTTSRPPSHMSSHSTRMNRALEDLLSAIELIKMDDPEVTAVDMKQSQQVLTSVHAGALIKALEGNTNLKRLDLQNSRIQNPQAIEIGRILKVNTGLEVLNLDGNFIGPTGIKSIASALPFNKTLRELRLGNQISLAGNEAEQALATAINKNETLLKVSFVFRDVGARVIVDKALSRNNNKFRGRRQSNF